MAKKKTDAALNDAIEKLEHVESEVNESLKKETPVVDEIPAAEETESKEEITEGHADPVGEQGPLGEVGADIETKSEEALKVEETKAEEKSADEDIVKVIEPVIPEPAYVVNGDMKVESFNHKSVTIDGKIYPIDRAQHKALVAGDFSVLKTLKK